MWVRWLVLVCAFVVLCGTPLASARTHAFGDPVGPVEATGPGGANVPFDEGGMTCDPSSNSLFGIGTTTVNCTGTDSDGNPTSASFGVTVQDTTGPSFSNVPADITTAATSSAGAVVGYTEPT